MNPDFEREWRRKVRKVRGSDFWQTVSTPPQAPVEPARQRPRRSEIAVDNTWSLQLRGDIGTSGAAARGAQDLRDSLARRLGIRLRRSGDGPCIALRLHPGRLPADRW